ncbi:D-alanyl-D-alanine carboxypeptidase/D-alanyl-D-alanine endopeptidase [Streptomyces fulvoviolaceus]|uniref:D-alanyl-D-alanine carboxypeptidase/D-alanyl-D-alanine endopeptidase n=1 Tax=Streptomyces fulvoviolaceus TaxID=285535 RepID=UPI0021BFEA89|nr:D-alanyl-D-alanine carboxypeptidase/D-alanyl-D-alanine-endopeptidase [Streptomyces fulvoviolaceus]MCT9082279.1 D-alanyl-D-alanine carboxypeptidase/D-alanyl-D-alanine-endopeptidase [Streptomyces fulvoviolaceus]
MVVPELRPWRAAKPHVKRVANAVRPRLARAADAVRPGLTRTVDAVRPRLARAVATAKPRVARIAKAAKPQVARGTRPKTWQFTAGAATAGLALAAAVATAAGPWDSSGQRTAERDRAAAQEQTGGADHGDDSDTTASAPRPAPSAASVLTGLGGAGSSVKSAQNGPALADVLDPLLADAALGTRHTAAVVDVATGKQLYGAGADAALTPASTTKIATAVAALSALGADHRLTTRAALEPDTKELVLVGGGDPTLTARKDAEGWASLRTLADETAAALKKRDINEVTLSYDTTLYAGSEIHPIGVNDNLAPVSALMADEARTDDSASGPAPRVSDPAADATRRFAEFLSDHGIRTTSPGPSKATGRSDTLAEVTSPPLSTLVERMLTNSDNDIAEALARQTAVASKQRADFAGGGQAIRAQLKKLGLPLSGADFNDGSGLDRADKLTADLLTSLLAEAGDPSHPELRPVLTGLPVAGFTGTLTSRYTDGAAGIVRAKTGTLTGVNTLAGTVVDQNGRLLAFAFLASDTSSATAAQAALDRTATALSACGCR